MSECEQISKRATWVRGGRDSQDTVEQKQTKDAPSIESPLRIPVRVEDFLVGCIFGQVVPAAAAGSGFARRFGRRFATFAAIQKEVTVAR